MPGQQLGKTVHEITKWKPFLVKVRNVGSLNAVTVESGGMVRFG